MDVPLYGLPMVDINVLGSFLFHLCPKYIAGTYHVRMPAGYYPFNYQNSLITYVIAITAKDFVVKSKNPISHSILNRLKILDFC